MKKRAGDSRGHQDILVEKLNRAGRFVAGLPASPLIPSRDSSLPSQGIMCLNNGILRPHLPPLSVSTSAAFIHGDYLEHSPM